jgi:excinuclease ABC subunit A
MARDSIVIRGAREHNLKGIDLTIPRDKLVVLTGVSGSGKSSLAFDTLYAEGQRRYVESLSAYARQFLGQLEKPKVDFIGGLSPAIAIEQKSASKNPRSTVGTVTEIYDYMRLLYGRVGTQHCHVCGQPVASQSAEQMTYRVLELPTGTRFMVLAPLVSRRKGEYKEVFNDARAEGFTRVRVNGEILDLSSEIKLNKKIKHSIEVVVDRLAVPAQDQENDSSASGVGKAGAGTQSAWNAYVTRLTDAIELAVRSGEGVCIISIVDRPKSDDESTDQVNEWIMSEANTCTTCGISFGELTPQQFSFNSPQGACPDCTGLGTRLEVDHALLVPNDALSLHDGAIPYWGELRKKKDGWGYKSLAVIASHFEINLDTPWRDLSETARDVILNGSGKERIKFAWANEESGSRGEFLRTWEGLVSEINRRYHQTGSDMTREFYASFMSEQPCPACHGARLRAESRAVRVGDWSVSDVCAMNISDAHQWAIALAGETQETVRKRSVTPLTGNALTIADDILKEIRDRLGFLLNVGLHYLTLERAAPSLSGGEAQRIRLASQIGSGLVGVMYILDEPSIGLHQRDNRKLLNTLIKLRDLGNSVIVVEHDLETMQAADFLIDFGPGAGVKGGTVVAAAHPTEVAKNEASITGAYLSGKITIETPKTRRNGNGHWIEMTGATMNNLRGVDIKFPLGAFVAVTGVSGSGKSSVINGTLYPTLANRLSRAQLSPGPITSITGLEHLDKVIDIDQQPIGRTPRSNPATYVKLFDLIRELYAQTPEAKVRGYEVGRFSFNTKGGRCEACEGAGVQLIDMQFLADVAVRCDVCKGKRYNRETLAVKYRGKTIADVLEMDVQTAMEFFAHIPRVTRILTTLHDVGLDYIALGQQATTLSGGEAQRIKLSRELARMDTGRTIYILDEPTTGLHFADVQRLLTVLHRLVDAGNTVLVIEHNLDVIKTADWIIDMGPEGGSGGGSVVGIGTPEEIAAIDESHTGFFLKEIFAGKQW